MKRSIILTCAFLLVLAGLSYGQISGTAHDFSSYAWSGNQICVVCHTPHNADVSVTNAPLWNHELSVVGDYTVYSTVTLDATVGQPDESSKLCLSCHDGTVALENFGGNTGGTRFCGDGTFGGYLGTNLGDDHPISFVYDATLAAADGELFDPATTGSGLGGSIKDKMLFDDKLQCDSCHDVHGTGISRLLLKSNAGSALCLTCHDK